MMTGRAWWPGGREVSDGIWEAIDGDQYRRQWRNQWGDGGRGCGRVFRDGATVIFDHVSGTKGTRERYAYLLLSGNPHGL